MLISILISDVVRLERPDLEQQRNELIVNINEAKNELKVCFTMLLYVYILYCVVLFYVLQLLLL